MIGKVLVLGCGPSGLLAAHAAHLRGAQVKIVSVKRPSQLYGCQYLHAPIPGLRSENRWPRWVKYELVGSVQGYAEKVYGPERDRSLRVSPETFRRGGHETWDIRQAYNELWDLYGSMVHDHRVEGPDDVLQIVDYFEPEVVFSTIPAPTLCDNPAHDFKFVKCWAIGDAPGQAAPKLSPPFTVICDGTPDQGYYRASNVYDYSTIEWPGWRPKPPIANVVEFLKPLSTDCDCLPSVMRFGRMGKWRKGVLAHDAFGEAMEVFDAPATQATGAEDS